MTAELHNLAPQHESGPVAAPDAQGLEARSDLLVGTKAIGAFLGIGGRQAAYLARIGVLPVYKLGRRLAATRTGLGAWSAENMARARREHEARRAERQ